MKIQIRSFGIGCEQDVYSVNTYISIPFFKSVAFFSNFFVQIRIWEASWRVISPDYDDIFPGKLYLTLHIGWDRSRGDLLNRYFFMAKIQIKTEKCLLMKYLLTTIWRLYFHPAKVDNFKDEKMSDDKIVSVAQSKNFLDWKPASL